MTYEDEKTICLASPTAWGSVVQGGTHRVVSLDKGELTLQDQHLKHTYESCYLHFCTFGDSFNVPGSLLERNRGATGGGLISTIIAIREVLMNFSEGLIQFGLNKTRGAGYVGERRQHSS